MSRRSSTPRPAAGLGTLLLVSLVGLALVLFGFLAGRSTSPSPAPPPARAAIPAPAGAARAVAGVPVAFPRSAAGAAQAAATYQRAFAEPAILRPRVLRARVNAVATPDYAARMLAANSPGQRRLAAGPIGIGLRRGLATIYTAVPVGYRIVSFASDRAEVETWGFTLLGNASAAPPSAYFGRTRMSLLWREGRWRIAATTARFGPTPRLGTRSRALDPYRVLELARGLSTYELAP